jgi:hypothetical protein
MPSRRTQEILGEPAITLCSRQQSRSKSPSPKHRQPIRSIEAKSSALKRIPKSIAVYDVYNDPALSFVGSLEG